VPPPQPVREAAITALLEPFERLTGVDPGRFIDLSVAAREARRFKVDVSFAIGHGAVRMSVNDKGEAAALRTRVRAAVPGAWPERFFGLLPAGGAQATLGLKASDGEVDRYSLYYEEFPDQAVAARTHRALFEALGIERGPPADLAGVCLDLDGSGTPIAVKDYAVRGDGPGFPIAVPPHPRMGTTRFLHAERTGAGAAERAGAGAPPGDCAGITGAPLGTKTIWVTESRTREDAARNWAVVDGLASTFGPDAASDALRTLRQGWRDPDAFLHADLVSADRDAASALRALVVYVSVR
jgi:hypothetical protein